MKGSPAENAAKWVQRTSGAVEDYNRGIDRVTVAPGAKAAANQAGYIAGIQRSANKWAQRVGSVSLEDWRAAAHEKGSQRLAGGVQAAAGKMEVFFAEVTPHVEAGQRMIAGMPKGDVEQGIARAAAFMRHMSQFRRSGRR